jgi:hypothetical protein
MRAARVLVAGADAPDELSGADVVVLSGDDAGQWAESLRDQAPAAVVVVVGGSPQAIYEATLFPRARIIGVADQAEADAVVDAVVSDSGEQLEVVVRCEGERGIDGEFARVPARIGASGVLAIVEN